MVPYVVDYEIPQADEDDGETHSAATTEQMDEEIEVDADVSMPQDTTQSCRRTTLSEENEEDALLQDAANATLRSETL
jgi:hypothetical protein